MDVRTSRLISKSRPLFVHAVKMGRLLTPFYKVPGLPTQTKQHKQKVQMETATHTFAARRACRTMKILLTSITQLFYVNRSQGIVIFSVPTYPDRASKGKMRFGGGQG